MATITSAQNKGLAENFFDLMGEDRGDRQPVVFKNITESLEYLGAVYAKRLKDELIKKDADGGGKLSDSIKPTKVTVMGSVYTIQISTKKYASFIDEGVNGWAKGRGSRFNFKKNPTRPKGQPFTGKSPFVESIKEYLARESKISKLTKSITVSARESKRASITDASTKAAIGVAYMIKRQGIKPTHFWRDATTDMGAIIKAEFSAALKIDIIQNIKG